MNKERLRFLLSRDDWYHQRGYWVVASALSHAGIEVILGGVQTPAEIAQTALTEDADMIGFRVMNASPQVIVAILFEELSKNDMGDIPVVVGGIVPDKDEIILREMGVKEIFKPFDPLDKIGARCEEIAMDARRKREQATKTA